MLQHLKTLDHIAMRVIFCKGLLTPVTVAREHEHNSQAIHNAVLDLARTGESTHAKIAERTGLPHHRVAFHLGVLRQQGKVIRDGQHFRLAPTDRRIPALENPQAAATAETPRATQPSLFPSARP